MAQTNNSSNAPYPLSTTQGGSGVNATALNSLQFVMGGDNGPQVTQFTAGVGTQITYNSSQLSLTNTTAQFWATYTSGEYGIAPPNCCFANCASGNSLSFFPYWVRSDYVKSVKILGIGAGLFSVENPGGGATLMCGNKTVPNLLTSTAIGDCVEIFYVNQTTYYCVICQGNFTIS